MEGNLAILEGNFDGFLGKSKFFPAVEIFLHQGGFPSSARWFPLCVSLFFPSNYKISFLARSFLFFFQTGTSSIVFILTLQFAHSFFPHTATKKKKKKNPVLRADGPSK